MLDYESYPKRNYILTVSALGPHQLVAQEVDPLCSVADVSATLGIQGSET